MPYTVKTIDELMNGPMTVDWVIDGIAAPKTSGMIAGAPGVGKTWMTLDLALSLAMRCIGLEKKWMGYFDVKPCRVLVIDEESVDLMLRLRFHDLCKAMAIDWHGLPIWVMTSQHVNLSPSKLVNGEATDPKKLKDLYRVIDDIKPGVIIWDSYARIHRSNENNADEMAAVLEQFKHICDKFDVCNVINHHLRKGIGRSQNDIRGSGDISAFQDWSFTVSSSSSKDAGPEKLRVEQVKSRWKKKSKVATFAVAVDDSFGVKLIHEQADEEVNTGELILNLCKDGMERQDLLTECSARHKSESTADRAISRLIRDNKIEKSREGKIVMYYLVDDVAVPMPFFNDGRKLSIGTRA
jgi:hypothetical protein